MIKMVNEQMSNPLNVIEHNLVETPQFSIFHQLRKTSQNIQKQQIISKLNQQKLKKITQRVSCLELMRKNSEKQSFRYQRQLQKLEETQGFATQLLQMKYESFIKGEAIAQERKKGLMSLRQSKIRQGQLCQSIYRRKKSEHIKRVREEAGKISAQYQRKKEEDKFEKKRLNQELRSFEQEGRQRLRRYEQFKLQQATNNYEAKVQEQLRKYRERSRYLSQLQEKIKKEEHVFRKTQLLEAETNKIESIYLTGTQ